MRKGVAVRTWYGHNNTRNSISSSFSVICPAMRCDCLSRVRRWRAPSCCAYVTESVGQRFSPLHLSGCVALPSAVTRRPLGKATVTNPTKEEGSTSLLFVRSVTRLYGNKRLRLCDFRPSRNKNRVGVITVTTVVTEGHFSRFGCNTPSRVIRPHLPALSCLPW